mmetsp:Transcript_2666/g.7105  ORF Transcript_2666/g.7105 Transcript_2666/m.7105 type:complete len:493 (-) Transcript_2666:354-1832(-)
MALGQQREGGALVGMRQNVPAFPSHDGNRVSALVKVVFGNDPGHAEPAVDTLLFSRIDHVQVFLGLEKRELVKQVFAAALVAGSVRCLLAAANQSKVPVGVVRPHRLPLRQVGVGEPLRVGHAHHSGGLLPVGDIIFHAPTVGVAIPLKDVAAAPAANVLRASHFRTGVPVHKVVGLGIFGSVLDRSHEAVQVSRGHPSSGGVLYRRIVRHHKGDFFFPIVQCLVVILLEIKDADSLVYGKVFGNLRVVRIPVIQDLQQVPGVGIILGRVFRTIVNVVGRRQVFGIRIVFVGVRFHGHGFEFVALLHPGKIHRVVFFSQSGVGIGLVPDVRHRTGNRVNVGGWQVLKDGALRVLVEGMGVFVVQFVPKWDFAFQKPAVHSHQEGVLPRVDGSIVVANHDFTRPKEKHHQNNNTPDNDDDARQLDERDDRVFVAQDAADSSRPALEGTLLCAPANPALSLFQSVFVATVAGKRTGRSGRVSTHGSSLNHDGME